MGVVYLTQATRLDRAVAIKVLPAAIPIDADGLPRFKRETGVTSAFNQPNILAINESDHMKARPSLSPFGPKAKHCATGRTPALCRRPCC